LRLICFLAATLFLVLAIQSAKARARPSGKSITTFRSVSKRPARQRSINGWSSDASLTEAACIEVLQEAH
jgi:hypothetical protein